MDNYLIGPFIGISQIFIGYPFDTIKTRIQYNNYNNHIFKNLYTGIKYPLLSSISCNFLRYGIFIETEKINDNLTQNAIYTGLITSPIVNLADIKKINMQNNILSKNLLKNYFKTLPLTTSIEIFGLYLYFDSYKYFKKNTNIPLFIAGGIIGKFTTCCTYPIDTIKTNLLCNQNIYNIIKKKKLYKGISYSIFRSFLIYGSGFEILNYFYK